MRHPNDAGYKWGRRDSETFHNYVYNGFVCQDMGYVVVFAKSDSETNTWRQDHHLNRPSWGELNDE